LDEKKEIIRRAEKKEGHGTVALSLGIPKSTVSTIVQNKAKILSAIEKGTSGIRKHAKSAKFTDVDAGVLVWMKQARAQNLPVSGPLVLVSW
jgi:hypothetical protein